MKKKMWTISVIYSAYKRGGAHHKSETETSQPVDRGSGEMRDERFSIERRQK